MATWLGAGALAYKAVEKVWNYNRDNFLLTGQLRQNRLHQQQNIAVSKGQLRRQDLRDLFGLTVAKMDCYTTMTTLLLGFCVTLYYSAQLPKTCQAWLWIVHALSLLSAFVYLMLSLWFAIYTSLVAQSLAVSVLTSEVRLDAPSEDEIDLARGIAAEFELDFKTALRVPFLGALMKAARNFAGQEGQAASSHEVDPSVWAGMGQEHIQYYQQLQEKWRGYDTHTRLCLNLGVCNLFQVLVYFGMAVMFDQEQEPGGALIFTFAFLCMEWLVIELDFILSRAERALGFSLMMLGPLLCACSLFMAFHNVQGSVKSFMHGGVCVSHLLKYMFLLYQMSRTEEGIPSKVRSITFLNVVTGLEEVMSGSQRRDFWGAEAERQEPEKVALHAILLTQEAKLLHWLELWTAPSTKEHELSSQEAATVAKLQTKFRRLLLCREERLPEVPAGVYSERLSESRWICLAHTTVHGNNLQRYFKPDTGETEWAFPKEEPAAAAPSTLRDVQDLLARYESEVRELRRRSWRNVFSAKPPPGQLWQLPQHIFWSASTGLLVLWTYACAGHLLKAVHVTLPVVTVVPELPHYNFRRRLEQVQQLFPLFLDDQEWSASQGDAHSEEGKPVHVDAVAVSLARSCVLAGQLSAADAKSLLDLGRRIARRLRREVALDTGFVRDQEMLAWLRRQKGAEWSAAQGENWTRSASEILCPSLKP